MDGGETPSRAARGFSENPYGAGGGAGGKLRREKKPPSTPYDRPPKNGGGWISRIVTPAKRLISGGATRILPSLFSPLSPPPPPDSPESPDRDEGPREIVQEAPDGNVSCSVDLLVPKSTEVVGSSKAKGKSKLIDYDEDKLDKVVSHSDGQLPDIEQLIRGKTFSREEIDHLMEVLQSKVGAEQEKQLPSMSGREEAERGDKPHVKQNALIDKDETENLKRPMTPILSQRNVQNDIGASPVDIARAYMGSRMSEGGFAPTGSTSKGEKFAFSSKFATNPMASPLSKAPTCWPGAITQDQQGYSTPQTQKSRYGHQVFPRTPYSRTIFSKANSKLTPLRGDSEKSPRTSLTPFQSMRTPVYGKSTTNMAEGSYGTGGPIRRMRNKLTSATPSNLSSMPNTGYRSPWTKEFNADFNKKVQPAPSSTSSVKAVDSKPQKHEVGTLSVHPHSSKLARQILEQLDRPITLKEKSEELKLASSWKKSSQAELAAPIQDSSSPSISEAGCSKNMGMDGFFNTQTRGGNHVLQNRTNTRTGAESTSMFMNKTSTDSGANAWPSPSIHKHDSQITSSDQKFNSNLQKGNGHSHVIGNESKGLGITNNSSGPEAQNVQRKPVLSSISIDKSGFKTSFSSDTSAGFTFSFATSSSFSVEPPTPSIFPSSSTSPPQKPQESINTSTGTSFSFGNKIAIASPVVSFPSTPNDTKTPKFKFGSGKPRLSFALGEDDSDFITNNAETPKFKFGSNASRLNFGSVESDGVCC